MIGPPPKSVYEIGSGKGGLIAFLAANGYECKGAEITRQRGEELLPVSYTNLSWGISDGVHLDRFERPETYDVVLSDQVIEHIHPDDLQRHLRSARSILKRNGRYIFDTPSRYTGPHDVSRVFKCSEPEGMHLREYTCRELCAAARRAGFSSISFGFVPRRFRIMLLALGAKRFAEPGEIGRLFLRIVFAAERFLGGIPTPTLRRLCANTLCALGIFSGTISLVAEK
ncbi:methyltransferase domain-containing protein [Mycobacterium sp.]|uniref:class I SAM-dependent methyltransferase n=1 Tax=Mycobacterium sp. TaxID=1785 RepID=UPI0025EC3F78|nr:methyltransferase domain-containing protein [Mycobacterium sp.]